MKLFTFVMYTLVRSRSEAITIEGDFNAEIFLFVHLPSRKEFSHLASLMLESPDHLQPSFIQYLTDSC